MNIHYESVNIPQWAAFTPYITLFLIIAGAAAARFLLPKSKTARRIILAMLAVLLVLLCSCGESAVEPEDVPPLSIDEVIPEDVVAANVWGYGELVEITEKDEIDILLGILSDVEFSPALPEDDKRVPGAVTLGINLTDSKGEETRITFALCEINGVLYRASGETAIYTEYIDPIYP